MKVASRSVRLSTLTMATEKAAHSKEPVPEKAFVGSLNEKLIEKAVTALLQHHAKSTEGSKDLLGNETTVQVQLGLDLEPKRAHVKPIRIDIPHGFQEDPQVCLIVKQESKAWVKELLSNFPEMKCVKKVLGLQSLRTKYADFAQRRELLHTYNVFMADDRILPMLSSALGKMFYKAKQQPIPIPVTRKSALPFHIIKALRSTYMSYAKGTSITIVAGRTGMDVHQLVQNVLAIGPQAAEKVPRKWANVRSIGLKTPTSMSLPVYNKTPEELIEIARLASLTPTWDEPQSEVVKPEKSEEQKAESKLVKEKSPLLRALKKQKQATAGDVAKEEKKGRDQSNTKEKGTETKSEKESSRVDEHSADELEDGMKAPMMGDTQKSKQKDSKSDERKRKKKEKSRSMDETKDLLKKTEATESDKSTKEDMQATKIQKKSTKTPESEIAGRVATFLPAKKYQGTKSGCVFKSGAKGLGYYLDVKPVVDKMAMEALIRLAEQKNSASRQSKSHKRRGKR